LRISDDKDVFSGHSRQGHSALFNVGATRSRPEPEKRGDRRQFSWLPRKDSNLATIEGIGRMFRLPSRLLFRFVFCALSSLGFAKDRKFHLDRRDAQRVRLSCEFNNRHAQAMTKGSDGTWSITCRYRRAHFLFPIQKNPGVDSTPGKEMRTRTNLRWHPMFSFRNVIWTLQAANEMQSSLSGQKKC